MIHRYPDDEQATCCCCSAAPQVLGGPRKAATFPRTMTTADIVRRFRQ
jgi:hypothetical protein